MDPQRQDNQGVPGLAPQDISAGAPPLPPLPRTQSVDVATPVQSPAGTPAAAADNDVIEPEWIQKAKQIIAATHDDPYNQVQQLNKLKAEYMQKRYNKTVKLADT